jgi:hypothetical protein
MVQLTSNLSGKVSKMTLSKKKRTKRDWYHKRDKALARVVEILEKGEKDDDDLNRALDALAVAHTAAAFEGWSGTLKW